MNPNMNDIYEHNILWIRDFKIKYLTYKANNTYSVLIIMLHYWEPLEQTHTHTHTLYFIGLIWITWADSPGYREMTLLIHILHSIWGLGILSYLMSFGTWVLSGLMSFGTWGQIKKKKKALWFFLFKQCYSRSLGFWKWHVLFYASITVLLKVSVHNFPTCFKCGVLIDSLFQVK